MVNNKNIIINVIKRNGSTEILNLNKIIKRIKRVIGTNNFLINPLLIADKLNKVIYDGINTTDIDNQIADICINMSTIHPIYTYVAGNILISQLHKKIEISTNNTTDFVSKMNLLSSINNNINNEWLKWINNNKNEINKIINYEKDYRYDYFGYRTLEKSYLMKINNEPIETPQDVLMRTAITLQMNNIDLIKKTYEYMSEGYYTHATPTLFNSGTKNMQLASCFTNNTEVNTLLGIKKIEDVKINDYVITHSGIFRKVIQLHKNRLNERHIYKLLIYNTKPINITNNHKLLTITQNEDKPTWTPVTDITENHYIGIPNYFSSKHRFIKTDVIYIFCLFLRFGEYDYLNSKISGVKFILNEIIFNSIKLIQLPSAPNI
jgi:hypothetical protein